jgi:hypothetical protein
MEIDLAKLPQISPHELVYNYKVLGHADGVVLVTEAPLEVKQLYDPTTQGAIDMLPDFRELGTMGLTSYGSIFRMEYNPDLFGINGLRTYDKMRRNDAQVRSTLRLIKTPCLGARWYIVPATTDPLDVQIADFVNYNLFVGMSASWPQLLTEILSMLDFGFYVLEKVWDIRIWQGQPYVMWKKLAPRHPLDLNQWFYDSNGGPVGISFYQPLPVAEPVFIPINKLLVFTFDKEAGDMSGLSVLRSAYKHWFYKENLYKVDAIQKERHGVGLPVVKLPPNFTTTDKALAAELGRNLRSNEKAHLVLPPNWEVVMMPLEGNLVNCIESIEHHDRMIMANVMGQFMDPHQGRAAPEISDMFMKTTRYIADLVRDVFNKYAIPELVDYNWPGVTNYPELRVRKMGETVDWRTISFAIRNFVGAGIIQPDDKLEEWIRDEMDLPPIDETTTRVEATPQLPGAPTAPGARVGPPRQSQAGNMKQQAQGTGKSNAGTDNSGGTNG